MSPNNNKKKNSNSKGSDGGAAEPPVSIITVTQIKRVETIKILAAHIVNQTYKNIVQWVIVEGSNNLEDALKNEANITLLQEHCPDVPITYIKAYRLDEATNEPVFNGDKLGQLRNVGNRACTGDITVCMDDDDYYFPTRVEHVVKMLTKSKCLIAGCSEKYLYDYCLKRFYKFKLFGPYHSTNDCMAWKKEYIAQNSHDPLASNAEESSFTNKFANPMVQLDPMHTIIASSHYMNTFNKKEICITGTLNIYPMIICLGEEGDEAVTGKGFMPLEFFQKYNALYTKAPYESPYDIVYFNGGTGIEWTPLDGSLGGSEQAIVNLSNEWTKKGKRVAVYGKVPDLTHEGVDYWEWKAFDWQASYKTVILWRHSGVNCGLSFPIKAEKMYVDFHDNIFQFRFDYAKYAHKIDRIFFKSEFHRECYEGKIKTPQLTPNDYKIIPNGIRVKNFSKQIDGELQQRNPYRFCYASCYTRGLAELLAYVWPVIYSQEPRAEFHIYYGMHHVQDQQFRQMMTQLLSQPGVMDHGRMPVEMIVREKHLSSFHFYVTDCDGEIDCISVRESLVAGCVPLLSKSGVFKNRDGLHFDLNRQDKSCYERIAMQILQLLQRADYVDMVRERLKQSPTIVEWDTVAQQWLDV